MTSEIRQMFCCFLAPISSCICCAGTLYEIGDSLQQWGCCTEICGCRYCDGTSEIQAAAKKGHKPAIEAIKIANQRALERQQREAKLPFWSNYQTLSSQAPTYTSTFEPKTETDYQKLLVENSIEQTKLLKKIHAELEWRRGG